MRTINGKPKIMQPNFTFYEIARSKTSFFRRNKKKKIEHEIPGNGTDQQNGVSVQILNVYLDTKGSMLEPTPFFLTRASFLMF